MKKKQETVSEIKKFIIYNNITISLLFKFAYNL